MAITDKKIMEKMEAELLLAKTAEQPEKVKQHIGRLQLLCELILEEEGSVSQMTHLADQSIASSLSSLDKIEVPNHKGNSLLDF